MRRGVRFVGYLWGPRRWHCGRDLPEPTSFAACLWSFDTHRVDRLLADQPVGPLSRLVFVR